jgi:general L-amino acid transport system substrate-binding protein
MTYESVFGASLDEVIKAYDSARCDALTSDASQLHAARLKFAKPDDKVIPPVLISKEPLGPAVRQGDDQWFNIVKWTEFAMINAEKLGVTSNNNPGTKVRDCSLNELNAKWSGGM